MKFGVQHIHWFVLLGGRNVEFVYLRALWYSGDRDICVVGFILN